jgi:osmotically-inducible protein OsmY
MKSDFQLQQEVMDQLAWEPKLSDTNINVSSRHGIIILSGLVDTYDKKITAEKAALKIAGVKGVAQELEVIPSKKFKRPDSDIAEAVVNALKWSTSVPDEQIKVKVQDGWVTMTGEVDLPYQIDEARLAVEKIAGIRGFANMVKVKSASIASNVKTKIEKAFQRSACLEAGNVHVDVEGNKVTLTGTLPSWHAIDEAVEAAWYAPGVMEIENKLEIEEPIWVAQI